jgi:peptide subunit release factor 1 (eRF1)
VIARLKGLEDHDQRVLSVFLTLDASTAEGRNIDAQFHDALQALRKREPDEVWAPEAERALNLIRKMPAGAQGVAAYTCAGTDFAMTVGLPMQVAGRAYWDRRAWLGPLRDLADPRNWLLIVVADKMEGRLFVAAYDAIHEVGNIHDATPPKQATGGQAQSNLARRHDEWVRRHARAIAEEVGKLLRTLRVGGVVIAAPPEMRALLLAELRARHRRLPLEIIHVAADSPPTAIREHAQQVMQLRRARYEDALIETLVEALGRKRAVTGIAQVSAAVVARQVGTLVCALNSALRGATCRRCELILPVTHEGPCPACGSTVAEQPDFSEYLADRVTRQGGWFERVSPEASEFLSSSDGIAALLRYPATRRNHSPRRSSSSTA